MKKTLLIILSVVCVMALFASTAFAAVSFNVQNGTGFVGKGDVQTAFGWNNAQLQKNLGDVTFYYRSSQEYTVTEEWSTLAGGSKNTFVNTHTVTKVTVCAVKGDVAFEARKQNQITGINLTGFIGTPSVTGGAIPKVGDITVDRKNERSDNTWFEGEQYPTDTVVTSVELTSSSGGLYAVYGGVAVLIW